MVNDEDSDQTVPYGNSLMTKSLEQEILITLLTPRVETTVTSSVTWFLTNMPTKK